MPVPFGNAGMALLLLPQNRVMKARNRRPLEERSVTMAIRPTRAGPGRVAEEQR